MDTHQVGWCSSNALGLHLECAWFESLPTLAILTEDYRGFFFQFLQANIMIVLFFRP
jgi:hypothetical protein